MFFKIKTTSYLTFFFRNKAVSDGAISFYLDHFVRTRVSKITYGSFCHIPYNPYDPEHQSRSYNAFIDVSGDRKIGGVFDIILPKVSCVILPQKYVIFFKKKSRIPKFRRRKNSDNLIPLVQILLISDSTLMILFGVTVETS